MASGCHLPAWTHIPVQIVQVQGTSASLQPVPFLNLHPREEFLFSLFHIIQPSLEQNPLPGLCKLDIQPSTAAPHAALPAFCPVPCSLSQFDNTVAHQWRELQTAKEGSFRSYLHK